MRFKLIYSDGYCLPIGGHVFAGHRLESADDIIEYASIPCTQMVTETVIAKDGSRRTITHEVPNELPTMAGFAARIGVSRDTLVEWGKGT